MQILAWMDIPNLSTCTKSCSRPHHHQHHPRCSRLIRTRI
jgi:hypothetical protein